MSGKILFERAYPLFGELVADKRGMMMTTLLELGDDDWVVWNGCEIERVDILEALEWATEFFSFSLLSQFIKTPERIEIKDTYAADVLWIDWNNQVVFIWNVHNKFIIDGEGFGSRDDAIAYAVKHLLTDEIYAANATVAAQYPEVEQKLKEW